MHVVFAANVSLAIISGLVHVKYQIATISQSFKAK